MTLRILVVDDEDTVRAFVERVLQRAGFQPVVAEDGATALAIAAASAPFDVLVTDLNMPEIGGEEVARHMRVGQPSLPVLYLTGYADRLFTQRKVLGNGEAFLEKPCTPTALVDAIGLVRSTSYLD